MPYILAAIASILGVSYCEGHKFDYSQRGQIREACQLVHDKKRADVDGFYGKYCNADGTVNMKEAIKIIDESEGGLHQN